MYNKISDDSSSSQKDEVIQSFEFLDDATRAYPTSNVLAPKDVLHPPPSCSLVHPDDNDNDSRNVGSSLLSRGRYIDSKLEEEECETTIAGMGLWTLCELEYNDSMNDSSIVSTDEANAALRKLLELVSFDNSMNMVPRHFFRLDARRFAQRGLTSEKIVVNYANVVYLLSCCRDHEHTDKRAVGLAMDASDVKFVIQNCPQLCLYKTVELEGLIRFLLQPLPEAGTIPSVAMIADRGADGTYNNNVDWPSLAAKGYGVGLTVDQATKAIGMMPELLALYYEDSRKPSLHYLQHLHQVSVPAELEVYDQLNLEGADPSDAFTFAYLHSLGVDWGQLRILQKSLPLWTTINIDPDWQLSGKGPIRSMLKRPTLDFLRQHLQIGPSDIYRLLKTHTRLSTYDSCNKMLPICDLLQSTLKLGSSDLRKIILRMPSLLGMGTSAFNNRLEFFTNEVDMSLDDLKVAVLKQPSLLQYGINSTLRPKLDFFLEELGMEPSSVSRLVKLAPAVVGLSLTENLRPKVASMMKLCALGPHEIGNVVSTSPQELLLSRKSKIEPTLIYLSNTLMLKEPRELGELILKAPRILRQGIETSLARKIDMLANSKGQKSKEMATSIVRNNPSLLTNSNTILEDRIKRCPINMSLSEWLLPSTRGRPKVIQKSSTADIKAEPILASPSADTTLDTSLTKIYGNIASAANDLGITKSAVCKACENKVPIVDGTYLYLLKDLQLTSSNAIQTHKQPESKTIPVSIFCAGGMYPSERDDVARGQSRTGGLSIQVFTDESIHDKAHFLHEFSIAAKSCFGITVPTDKDDSKLIAIFPGFIPTKRRCELFSCQSALRIIEAFLRTKSSEENLLYDIKVYTDSGYAWKLVRSKEKLLDLGACVSSKEMMARLEMANYTVNIDILHPLVRSFTRLNGRNDPSRLEPFKNASVEFRHSMDEIPLGSGLAYLSRLKREARFAAMWQFNRERNQVS